jgi:hypothetical protein
VDLSPFWPGIIASGSSHSVKTDINPSSLGGPIELFDLSHLDEPVKLMGLNVVMPVISKLYMKKHRISFGVVWISAPLIERTEQFPYQLKCQKIGDLSSILISQSNFHASSAFILPRPFYGLLRPRMRFATPSGIQR